MLDGTDRDPRTTEEPHHGPVHPSPVERARGAGGRHRSDRREPARRDRAPARPDRVASRRLGGLSLLPRSGFIPRADVEETDDAYLVELELPGVHKKEIDIAVAGRRLTVSGERKEKERVGLLRRRTRSVGRFHYEVVLPSPVDPDAVDATLDDGVLTVRVPKAAGQQPKRIEVS